MLVPFKIFKVDPKEALKIASEKNDPHAHEFEELQIGLAGGLEHFIDFKTTHLVAPFVSFVTKGKVHRVRPGLIDDHCDIWVIRFKSEFIPETIFQLYAHFHDHANIQMQQGYCFDRLVILCEVMQKEMEQALPDYGAIRHLLSALFTMIATERKKVADADDPLFQNQSITFRNFLNILEENFRRPESVDFYAEKLFMSSRNLNLICKNILQQSIFELIKTRKLIEAKNLLITTDRTIAEIGYELGYNEKSYFTNVFKKKAGQTPSDFREEMRKIIS